MNDERPKRLAKAWEDYERKVLPPTAGRTQRIESRRAFYAGAQTIMAVMIGGMSDSADVEPEEIDLMENLDAELKAYVEDVLAGKA